MHEDMRCPQCLFVCCCFSVLAVTASITGKELKIRVTSRRPSNLKELELITSEDVQKADDEYSCVTAYWDSVSCVLHVAADPPNDTYSMKFTRLKNKQEFSCPLAWTNHTYRCDCTIIRQSETFTAATVFAVEVCSSSKKCQPLKQSFTPSKHIQLTTPSDVAVQQTPGAFSFTWKSGYEGHRFFKNALDYELVLEAFQGRESKPFDQTLHCKNPEKAVSIPRSHLRSYAKYCIKVRSFSNTYNISSKWGNWTCWENDDVQKVEKTPVILAKVLALLFVGVAVLLFMLYSPAASLFGKMKIKTLSHTPSPAPFFQPLFQQHEGNLQDWLSPRHKRSVIYKTEEMLTTDAVTVVPKPMKRDPEENLDFQVPSVTLPASLCQTSYVGLPEMQKASCPVTTVCPGNTSYTQLPFSVWDFNTEVVPSPPRDSLEMSCSDSGCSLESLTESPDCSLPPTSPAVESSPPFRCSDYCVINKTAEGVVPVLVTKGSSTNCTSETHQREDES